MDDTHCNKLPASSGNLTLRCAAVFDTYQDQMHRRLVYLTGSREEADDLSQELWLRVLRSGHTYRGQASPETWLYAVCRNLVIDQRRKRRLLSLDEVTDLQNGACSSHLIDHRPTPIEVLRQDELSHHLARLVFELDDKQSMVIALRFWADCELNEISEITNVPLNTVKARLYRGLRSLKGKVTTALAQGTIDFDFDVL